MKRLITCCVFTVLVQALTTDLQAQTPPLYSFKTYSLDSGTSNTVGAVYRFTNVLSGVDAFIKVTAISSGMTLKDIDRTADGYLEAFQPEYRINGSTNGYIDFKITFVNNGGNTPQNQALVAATGLDIDGSTNGGNTLKEMNRIDMGGGTSEYNSYSSQLIISQTGTAFTGANNTGILFGALVDTTAKEVMYTVTSANVTTIDYRVGANNQTTSTSTRYASLYFKKFTYQHFPLAISGLMNFQGSVKGSAVNLNWEIAGGKYQNIVLEKSNTGSSFTQVADFITGNQTRFDYSDQNPEASVVNYRLKATTNEGKTEFSQVLLFRLNELSKDDLKVYPSVITDATTVSIKASDKMESMIQVTDLSGRAVNRRGFNLVPGTNNISLDGFDKLPAGNYIVSVRTATSLLSKMVIVR